MKIVISFFVVLVFIIQGCQLNVDADKEAVNTYQLGIPENLPSASLPVNNTLTNAGVALGRKLFYDPILSRDSTISCASCHKQQFAFSDNLAHSVGVDGKMGRRNTMPLFNLMWNEAFFWDGRAVSLHHQALVPMQDSLEMDESLQHILQKLNRSAFYPKDFSAAFENGISIENMTLALEQFLVTIVSGNSKFDRYKLGIDSLSPAELRGLKLFNSDGASGTSHSGADCFHCHGNSLFSNGQFSNNGLDSIFFDAGLGAISGLPEDAGKFKVPSLRNIALTAPYMHDGRFKTLEEVLDFYNSGVKLTATIDANMHAMQNGLKLTAQEKADLISFLKTLTDSTIISNLNYSNPFGHL